MIPTIFLDSDGVCVDFVSAALEIHNSPLKHDDIGQWAMEGQMGLTLDEFWAPIEAAGPGFWRGLKEYPWFEELYAMCLLHAKEVYFLSSPDRCPAAAMGKMQWLMDRFGNTFRNYILTPNKGVVRGGVLIDDSPKHCETFARGNASSYAHDLLSGRFVLFLQPWNHRGPIDRRRFLVDLELHLQDLAAGRVGGGR